MKKYAIGDWYHLFEPGNKETRCRITIDLEQSKLVAAQEWTGLKFEDVLGDRLKNLSESVIEVNQAHANVEEWAPDLGFADELPEWVSPRNLHGNVTLTEASRQRPLKVRPDMLFVIGIKDAVTDLAERLCNELGLSVHFAMKKSDSTKRIDSMEEDAVIMPPLPSVESVFCCGLKASNRLVDWEGGPLDCNWTADDASAFAQPLLAFLHASHPPLAPTWRLQDLPNSSGALDYDYRNCPVGHFGPSGTVIADFGAGKQFLLLPQAYSSIFPQVENKLF